MMICPADARMRTSSLRRPSSSSLITSSRKSVPCWPVRAAASCCSASNRARTAARTGQHGTLFLDDVMSELDDGRRRLLVRILASAGQIIITTTDRHYFTEQELAEATVIELPCLLYTSPSPRDRQ